MDDKEELIKEYESILLNRRMKEEADRSYDMFVLGVMVCFIITAIVLISLSY